MDSALIKGETALDPAPFNVIEAVTFPCHVPDTLPYVVVSPCLTPGRYEGAAAMWKMFDGTESTRSEPTSRI